jgi:hypothetical protein
VAADPQQYVEIAVALGTDTPFREAVVQQICQASPLLFEDPEAVDEHHRIFLEWIERSRSIPLG